MSAGVFHTCARRRTGQVVCWGGNGEGQLGDGTREDRSVPVPVTGLTDAVALAASLEHTCAQRSSGEWLCWGRERRLDDVSARTRPGRVSRLRDAIEIEAGDLHACVRQRSGSVECAGQWPVRIAGAAELTVGSGHVCARRQDRVYCFGINDRRQLGDGTSHEHRSEVLVEGVTGATAIAAGGKFTCALVAEGGVVCWGDNEWSQCGNGRQERSSAPSPVTVLAPHPR